MAVRLAAVAVAFAAIAAVAAVADSSSESFYAVVENRLSSAGGMDLVCRAVGHSFFPELSVVPRGHVPRGDAGRRVVELIVQQGDDEEEEAHQRTTTPEEAHFVRCSWAYAGNYVADITLLDPRWAEARECQDPRGGAMCRVVFERDAVRLETPSGGVRVIGDLPVKRCQRNWLLFSTECTYPDHPHHYAGRRLGNAFQYFAI
ncbi:hypothetical protein PR202_gb22902 [Eleusine coracana subsp. coracana]|uniref:DUF7771 domain-containing protein n=1 Tax=Eleusine coracana subsp. coracana TaxID=191504 RepID=A0AAV5FIG2_ELECO|nr:hypothetical protein QOZ80_6BG0485100 [Eleusine coracana subsp. coracana]GJN34255.1 hypothetical protein PR202_gb22902 [Eleusine coracana subsp. coracana]